MDKQTVGEILVACYRSKTMGEAAAALGIHVSDLRRRLRAVGIGEIAADQMFTRKGDPNDCETMEGKTLSVYFRYEKQRDVASELMICKKLLQKRLNEIGLTAEYRGRIRGAVSDEQIAEALRTSYSFKEAAKKVGLRPDAVSKRAAKLGLEPLPRPLNMSNSRCRGLGPRICELKDEGLSQREIAAKLKCSTSTVYYHLDVRKRYEETGEVPRELNITRKKRKPRINPGGLSEEDCQKWLDDLGSMRDPDVVRKHGGYEPRGGSSLLNS